MSRRAQISDAVEPCTSVKRLQARAREPEEDWQPAPTPRGSRGPQGDPAGRGNAQDHSWGWAWARLDG